MEIKRKVIIKVRNLNKTFQTEQVLANINVDFEEGKIYGIIGRNGSGKTVFLKCLCGLLQPTKGIVSVNEKIVGKTVDFPEEIGFIIEMPGFLPNYSGYQNLKYLASIRKKATKENIYNCISLVGLKPDDRKHVGKYSLGMKQRLGIAQAIMENPQILILDEPMNGLDQKGVEEMRTLFLKLKSEGKVILLASHNREDIETLCDEVYLLNSGIMRKL